MSILSFARLCRDISQAMWKTFTWFCSKFIQITIYQFSSELPEFMEDITKKTFWFFSGLVVHIFNDRLNDFISVN